MVLAGLCGKASAGMAEPPAPSDLVDESDGADEAEALRRRVIAEAADLLDQALVSYVYGGYQVGDSDDCKQCNICLTAKRPAPSRRLAECPSCARCSLDCTHFIARVYDQAGGHYPYIDTKTMLALSAHDLKRRYGLIDLGTDVNATAPGDILVYDGHAVLLERRHAPVAGQALYRGDVVHATGGGVIRRPGEGLQRERFVDLTAFRGPLRRILRHGILAGLPAAALPAPPPTTAPAPRPAPGPAVEAAATAPPAAAEKAAAPQRKLRRVEKRKAGDDG